MKRRLLLLIITVCVTLAACELLLRLLHIAEPFRAFEEVTAADGTVSLHAPYGEKPRYRIHETRFPRAKTPGRMRVFVFGGSTTYGMPYTIAAGKDGDVSYGPWLRAELTARYGSEIELVNCGAIGMPVDGVRDLVEECLDYEPDLFLVLSGHNEFLPHALLKARSRFLLGVASPWRKIRLIALLEHFAISLAEVENRGVGTLDYPVAETPVMAAFHTPAEHALIHARYRQTLEWIVKACGEQGVPLILGTPPSNLLDYEPSFSALNGSSPVDVERWDEQVRDGRSKLEAGRLEEARAILMGAVAAEPDGAEAHYRLGLTLAGLSDGVAARRELEAARDLDGGIRRATTGMTQAVRDVVREGAARGQRIVLADADAEFSRASPLGLPGRNLFVDHVHPNLDGVALLAQVMRQAMAELGMVDQKAAGPAVSREAIEATLKINAAMLYGVDFTIGRNYANLIMLRHHDPEWRYQIAAGHMRRVIDKEAAYTPAHVLLGCLQVLAKHPDLARAAFATATRLDPNWRAQLKPLLSESQAIQALFRAQGFGDLLDVDVGTVDR